MSTRILLTLVPAAAFCTGLLAQESKPPAPAAESARTAIEQQVDRQAEEMRRQMVEGKSFRSHVRVTARLKNGNTVRGIVKDGLLVERLDGLRFVQAEEGQPGAGIRIYYWNGGSSYVFLRFDDIKECRINERLTPAQLREIEAQAKQREEAQQQAQKKAASQDDATDQPTPSPATAGAETSAAGGENATEPRPTAPAVITPPPGGAAPNGAPASGLSKEQQELFALVQEFPPQAGWSLQRRDEISRRMAVIGAKPSPSELRFVAKFVDWQRACEVFRVKPAEQPTPATETDAGRRSRRSSR